MKNKFARRSGFGWPWLGWLVAVCFLGLSGCASKAPEGEESSVQQAEVEVPRSSPLPMPPLSYYRLLSRMTPAELGRERMVLAALPRTPNTQVRLAMLLAYPRAQQDIARAMTQLDAVLKSNDPAAVALHPLARLLADNY